MEVAVGLAGHAQSRGAGFQGHQGAAAYRQRILKICSVKEIIHSYIGDVFLPDDGFQLFQLVAVTGKQEQNILFVLQGPDGIENGVHILHGPHVAEIGHHKLVPGHGRKPVLLRPGGWNVLLGIPVWNHRHPFRGNVPVAEDVVPLLRRQGNHMIPPAEDAAVDVVHQTADHAAWPQGIRHRSNLGIQVIGHKNQLGSEQRLGPGGNPGQNGRIGVHHRCPVPGDLRQVQQHHEGEGKIVHQPPQKS